MATIRRGSTTVTLAVAVLVTLAFAGGSSAQQPSKVERLGYPAGTKLLIVHADDLGLAHSEDSASIVALEGGAVSSGSVMMPAPWANEIIAWAKQHPDADIGIHTTLTAEWHLLRWPGLVSRAEAPTLYDAQGFLPASTEEVARQASAADVEKELRAEVARARELGLRPTHLDFHMAAVMVKPEFFQAFLRVARENHIVPAIPMELLRANIPMMGVAPGLWQYVKPEEVLVDHFVMAMPGMKPEQWPAYYEQIIRALEPGSITQIIVHLGYDDAELRAVTEGHPEYGAAWRQRDLDFFTSPAAKKLLTENNVRLTTWRELSKLLPPAS